MEKVRIDEPIVSHSMAEALASCRRKAYYAHVLKLQSTKQSSGLTNGNNGHKFMDVFFTNIMNGKTTAESQTAAMTAYMGIKPTPSMEILNKCLKWVAQVWPRFQHWKIVATEQTYWLQIGNKWFPYTADLLIEDRGVLKIVDHKFLYDPYSKEVMELLPQIPKYIGAMRAMGTPVQEGLYNIIRTRKTDIDEFLQVPIVPTTERIKNSMRDQIELSTEMIEGFAPTRTANKMNCDHCSFKDLCIADLNGEKTKVIIDHYYEPNTYGYSYADMEKAKVNV